MPNNMAICLSGDFDPDQMIATIDKYFGGLKPNTDLPKLDLPKETPITAPVVREVIGPKALPLHGASPERPTKMWKHYKWFPRYFITDKPACSTLTLHNNRRR